MIVREIIAGIARSPAPRTLRLEPRGWGVTVVLLEEEGLAPSLVASAIRETMAEPERRSCTAEIPFVRVVAAEGELEIAVADDATGGGRMFTETRGGGAPLMLESETGAGDRDARIEALLGRIAVAAGVEDAAHLAAALAREELGAAGTEAHEGEGARTATPEELAYVADHARAARLARDVRAIDDRMTASVVPDWLWIATGLGGAGVFMTAIALLYPELRVYVVPALVVLSLIGFAAYGAKAWRELRTRGVLLGERAELRAQREEARAGARARAEVLRARGVDPDGVLVRHGGVAIRGSVPAIVGKDVLDPVALARLDGEAASRGRQIVVFAPARAAAGIDAAIVRRFTEM